MKIIGEHVQKEQALMGYVIVKSSYRFFNLISSTSLYIIPAIVSDSS